MRRPLGLFPVSIAFPITLALGFAAACGADPAGEDVVPTEAGEPDGGGGVPGSPDGAPAADAADSSSVCAAEQRRCSVDFELADPGAVAVELRGDFAPGAWARGVPMSKVGTTWRATVPLKIGAKVEYKYCIDPSPAGACKSWTADTNNPVVPPRQNNQIAGVSCATYTCVEAPTTLRFIAVGDTGKGNAGQYEVARAMEAKCGKSGCDFVLMLGDNIYNSGASSPNDPAFREKFEAPYAGLDLPFYVVLGNHDYGGNGAGDEFGKELNEIEYSKQSKKWTMPAAYYRFKKIDTEFFGLDTNAQLYSKDAQQKADVKDWLSKSTATWKIAFGHHPYRSNGPHGNAGTYDGNPNVSIFNGVTVKAFADDAVCGQADLYLSGHDHSRQWLTDTCNGTELVVSGTGASPSELSGGNPTRFQSNSLGFLYVTIEGKNLVAEMVETNGSTSFTRTLTK